MARNYKAEYRRRVARGKKRGLSKAKARGHTKPSARPPTTSQPEADSNLNAAIKAMNRGSSLTAAARSAGVSPKRLRNYVQANNSDNRKGDAGSLVTRVRGAF